MFVQELPEAGDIGPDVGNCRHPTVFRPLKILAGPRTQDFKSASELLKADVRFTPKSGHGSSGSILAESAVQPTMSENITVTWRRSARSSRATRRAGGAIVASPDAVFALVSARSAAMAKLEAMPKCRDGKLF